VGLAISGLSFCARGLVAEVEKSPKPGGRTVSNAGAWAGSGESRLERRAPREPALLRQEPPVEDEDPAAGDVSAFPRGFKPEQLVAPGGLSSTINLMVVLTVLSLAPSILIMTTCFIRFIIVMSLLRQALGTQQLPPNQVLITLCLFLTFMVMAPVWQQSYDQGIKPYTTPEPDQPPPTVAQTFDNTVRPVRNFMQRQIEQAGNTDTVWMFLEYQHPEIATDEGERRALPTSWDEVSLPTLLSAYMLSELKVAFIIGFQIFLPFLVIDMVVSTVLMSMGMMMLPPTLISFPFKLLLFVLIDGWARIVGMMLASVQGP
jgi:flagellar biosynthetic protein FliP